MKRLVLPILLSVAVVGGCASQPSQTPAAAVSAQAPADCSQLQAEISATEKARRVAQEKQQTAWKAIVPFVVAAHHARAKSEVAETDKRLAELKAEATRGGCAVVQA